MSYRDERAAAEARVASLEKQLATAKENLAEMDEEAKPSKPSKPSKPRKAMPSEKMRLARLVRLAKSLLLALSLVTALSIFLVWCNNSADRGLTADNGSLRHIQEYPPGHALIISSQHVYDYTAFTCNNKGHVNDMRLTQVELATGKVLHSTRLRGGDGFSGVHSKATFVGRHNTKLWFSDPARGLHARNMMGEVVTDETLFASVPGAPGLGSVLTDDGMYVGGDDGYWVRVGEGDGEAVRLAQEPKARSNRPRFLDAARYPSCSRSEPTVRVVAEPNTPRSVVHFEGATVPNTAFLEVKLVRSGGCPLVLADPPSVVITTKERVRGAASTRRVTVAGETVWQIDEAIESLDVFGELLLEEPTKDPIVLRARSAATGSLVWETAIR